jgi:hypothetical protein
MHLEISVGESRLDKDYEKEHVKDLAGRVKELNHRLQDIRREQQFQREREILFRELSEKTNQRAVWWSLLQILVLFYMCVWQLRHLRGFFESKSTSLPHRSLTHTFITRLNFAHCSPSYILLIRTPLIFPHHNCTNARLRNHSRRLLKTQVLSFFFSLIPIISYLCCLASYPWYIFVDALVEVCGQAKKKKKKKRGRLYVKAR